MRYVHTFVFNLSQESGKVFIVGDSLHGGAHDFSSLFEYEITVVSPLWIPTLQPLGDLVVQTDEDGVKTCQTRLFVGAKIARLSADDAFFFVLTEAVTAFFLMVGKKGAPVFVFGELLNS